MKGPISLRESCVRCSPAAPAVLLSLLVVTALCGGQQPPPTEPNSAPSVPATPPAARPAKAQPQPRVAPPLQPRRGPLAARLKTIQLPEPVKSSSCSLEQALAGQRHTEQPANQRLEFPKVGQLAWAAQGSRVPAVTNPSGPAQVPAEVAAMIRQRGFEPVWKDWDKAFQDPRRRS